ncbi:MAG TPA: 2-hydroxyacyl-CoA dehydratase family protein [Bacillota bacterium]|nr:2-hydroxyacyl-CoA dehydratase family protein [Bacillota bacterium]
MVETINKLGATHPPYENIGYFFNQALKYSLEPPRQSKTPQVALLGLNIPEELIYATGAEPLWILGGSYGAALYADPFVPRDTDSVSKAGLGYLFSEVFEFTKDVALTVVPITSDSMRKIAYLLAQDREVITVDIPPVKEDPSALPKWLVQMEALTARLETKTRQRMSKKSLMAAIEMVNQAKREIKRLASFHWANPELLSGALVAFIINTYYYATALPEWIAKLKALNDELQWKFKQRTGIMADNRPRIIIAGSPVYFPNYKVPLILQELNVSQITIAHELTYRCSNLTQIPDSNPKLPRIFESLVCSSYLGDTSAAFVDSKTRMDFLAELANSAPYNGVVYHVLKGQIEYDFELERCESFFGRKDVPFFRLETDFNRQDVEQLKIRLEAFIEMIEAKYYQKRASG